jgi:hypothetical protein
MAVACSYAQLTLSKALKNLPVSKAERKILAFHSYICELTYKKKRRAKALPLTIAFLQVFLVGLLHSVTPRLVVSLLLSLKFGFTAFCTPDFSV